MQNFFGNLFVDLSNHIKAAVADVKWVDQDFGQLEQFEYRPSVDFPCVLIDFPSAQYSNMATLSQLGEVVIQLRIGFAPFSQAYTQAPLDVREKALEYYTLEQKVFEAVQGWESAYCQPLIRINAATEHRDNDQLGLRVRVLSFTTSFEDNSNYPVYNKVTATPKIKTS